MFTVNSYKSLLYLDFDDKLKHSEHTDYDYISIHHRISNYSFKKIIFNFSNTRYIDTSHLCFIHVFANYLTSRNLEVEIWSYHKDLKNLLTSFCKDTNLYFNEKTSDFASGHTQKNSFLSVHHSTLSIKKRVIDIFGSIAGLVILILTFPIFALLIKISSKGPIFFLQKRVGLNGKTFLILKYRTMQLNAIKYQSQVLNEIGGPFFKSSNDPRITSVGHFLRKYSLDEIPQFVNVFFGQMSLVGTRPPTLTEVSQYEFSYWQRLDVKPGMTGEWQVSGRSNIRHFDEVLKHDLEYQKKWSNLYDIKIILQTIILLFSKNSGSI